MYLCLNEHDSVIEVGVQRRHIDSGHFARDLLWGEKMESKNSISLGIAFYRI